MSEVTGIEADKLPPRVLHLRSSQVLSMWLGESDKQIDRFFDEVEQLAAEDFTGPDGKKYNLPVMVIAEEIDCLARSRGGDSDAVHDRIQTTLLQRLDTTTRSLKDKLIVFVFTSNVPHLIDPAFLRRAGGTIERFYRLEKEGFMQAFARVAVAQCGR